MSDAFNPFHVLPWGMQKIDLTLIPFGLSKKDGGFLDVSEVPRGKQCGCVCPSCRTPLIARQGKVREWYFAHASRSVFSATKKECEYSFFVSVRMMARQIIGDTLEIVLPKCEGRVQKHLVSYEQWVSETFTVADKQNISLADVEVEKSFMGVPVDLYGWIKEIPFVIYFVHPGRDVPHELQAPENRKCGIVSISLTRFADMFQRTRDSEKSYREILYDYLVNDIESKKWVFHPRYANCKLRARQALEQKSLLPATLEKRNKSGVKSEPNLVLGEPTPQRLVRYRCVMCNVKWEALGPGPSACPKCNSPLYRTVDGYVENGT